MKTAEELISIDTDDASAKDYQALMLGTKVIRGTAGTIVEGGIYTEKLQDGTAYWICKGIDDSLMKGTVITIFNSEYKVIEIRTNQIADLKWSEANMSPCRLSDLRVALMEKVGPTFQELDITFAPIAS